MCRSKDEVPPTGRRCPCSTPSPRERTAAAIRKRRSRAQQALTTALATGDNQAAARAQSKLDALKTGTAPPIRAYTRQDHVTAVSTPGRVNLAGPAMVPAQASPTTRSVQDQIRDTVRALAQEPGRWSSLGYVRLADVRDRLSHLDRADVDRALDELITDPDVSLTAELNQKTLTDRDRAAAVHIGGEDRHVISFSRRHRQADPDALERVRRQGIAASSDADLMAAMHTPGVDDELYREIRAEERRRQQPAAASVHDQIRDAARTIASQPGRWVGEGWVNLTELRDQLPHVDRAEFNKAVKQLALDPDAWLIAEANQRILTDRDRAEAIVHGGEAKHVISFRSHRQADPDALERVRSQGVAAASDADLVAALHTRGVGDELYRQIRAEETRRQEQPVTATAGSTANPSWGNPPTTQQAAQPTTQSAAPTQDDTPAAALPRIKIDRSAVAESFWDGQMSSVKGDITRSVNKRFKDTGLAGLRRRHRYLSNKADKGGLSPREFAELHLLARGIDRAKAEKPAKAKTATTGDVTKPQSSRRAGAATKPVPRDDVLAPVSGTPGDRGDLEARIRAAYRELARSPRDWVGLVDLWPKLGDVQRKDVEAVLKEMSRTGKLHLVPESNRKTLRAVDHEAAVRLGGDDNHLISIENG
jgi:hypothetical protein